MENMAIVKDDLELKATALVESGFFPDIKSVAQAKVKIWIGRSLGLNEYQSLTGVYLTAKGQIGLMASVMSSLIKTNPKYDYSVDELTNTKCSITFYKITADNRDTLGNTTFDDKDAARCGLANKDTFKAYPRNLLFARALSNGARFFCPDAICGYYEVSELEDEGWNVYEPKKKTVSIDSEGTVSNVEKTS